MITKLLLSVLTTFVIASLVNSEPALPEGTLHFRQADIIDRVRFGKAVTAGYVQLPADWTFEGEISWDPDGSCMTGPLWNWKAKSPDGKAEIARV